MTAAEGERAASSTVGNVGESASGSNNDPILVDCGVLTGAPEAYMPELVNCGLIVPEEDGRFIHTGGSHSGTSPPTAKRQPRPVEQDFEDGERQQAMEQLCRERHLLPPKAERTDAWAKSVGYQSYKHFLKDQCDRIVTRVTWQY